jgi:hypothetical protein
MEKNCIFIYLYIGFSKQNLPIFPAEIVIVHNIDPRTF